MDESGYTKIGAGARGSAARLTDSSDARAQPFCPTTRRVEAALSRFARYARRGCRKAGEREDKASSTSAEKRAPASHPGETRPTRAPSSRLNSIYVAGPTAPLSRFINFHQISRRLRPRRDPSSRALQVAPDLWPSSRTISEKRGKGRLFSLFSFYFLCFSSVEFDVV